MDGGCSTAAREIKKHTLILLIVGEDLSGTFTGFAQITDGHLKKICDQVSINKGGGKVVFIGIGSTTPIGYATCTILPLIENSDDATVSEKIKNKKSNEKKSQKNKVETDRFIQETQKILAERRQPHTDINGFFEKVRLLLNESGNDKFEKWLYINSDGKQSTKNTNKIDCSLIPSDISNFCINGWKAKDECGASCKFLSPGEFIAYFSSKN